MNHNLRIKASTLSTYDQIPQTPNSSVTVPYFRLFDTLFCKSLHQGRRNSKIKKKCPKFQPRITHKHRESTSWADQHDNQPTHPPNKIATELHRIRWWRITRLDMEILTGTQIHQTPGQANSRIRVKPIYRD